MKKPNPRFMRAIMAIIRDEMMRNPPCPVIYLGPRHGFYPRYVPPQEEPIIVLYRLDAQRKYRPEHEGENVLTLAVPAHAPRAASNDDQAAETTECSEPSKIVPISSRHRGDARR